MRQVSFLSQFQDEAFQDQIRVRVCVCVCVCVCVLLGPHPQHMEVPGLGVELEL